MNENSLKRKRSLADAARIGDGCTNGTDKSRSDSQLQTETKNRHRSLTKNDDRMEGDNEKKSLNFAKRVENLESSDIVDEPRRYSRFRRRRYRFKKNANSIPHIKNRKKIVNIKLDDENDSVNNSNPKFTSVTDEKADIPGLGREFPSRLKASRLLIHHNYTNHGKGNVNTTSGGTYQMNNDISSESTSVGTKIFECFYCHLQTESLKLLKTHIQIHLADSDDRGSDRHDKSGSPIAHDKGLHDHRAETRSLKHTNLSLPHACPYCAFRCGLLRDLREHVYVHTESKPFYCNICYHRSSTTGLLQRHMSTHTGIKPYKCRKCDYKTAYRGSLSKHESRIHGN